MAFFEKVPRELRDQVYRELLLDNVPIEPYGRQFDNKSQSKTLSPVVLRLSKKTHAEASKVLYEENRFRYNSEEHTLFVRPNSNETSMVVDRTWTIHELSMNTLKKVKHVEICYRGSTPEVHRLNSLCGRLGTLKIVKVLHDVAESGCSLKTLRLSFMFKDSGLDGKADGPDKVQRDIAPAIAGSKSLRKIVASMKVEQKVEISVLSRFEWECKPFSAFVNKTASIKGWTSSKVTKKWGSIGEDSDAEPEDTHLDDEASDDESEEDGSRDQASDSGLTFNDDGNDSDASSRDGIPDYGIRYAWSWILTPSTMGTSTMDRV